MNAIHHAAEYTPENALIVGAGYLGLRVAKRIAKASKTPTYATTRSRRRFFELAEAGLVPLKFDWTDSGTFAALPVDRIEHVLIAVSYDRKSSVDRYTSQLGGLIRLLRKLQHSVRICYISTTGVYHQGDGRWVDERSPTRPSRLGGRVHLAAEERLHALRPNDPWVILRLAGIYGPNRIPRAADVIGGRAIRSSADGYLNLIHVDDAVRATIGAWQFLRKNEDCLPPSAQARLFAVADDRPIPRRRFYEEIAVRTNSQPPKFLPPTDDAPERMRSDSNKRVSNRKMKRFLLPELLYPDYRHGLADLLR
ncbi:MAG: NAD-dependent epimerase/dehydratase family protein [Planctomycetota bacterium]